MNDELIFLDESYLSAVAELYQDAFNGDPWNDDWSDGNQLREYIKDVSNNFQGLNYGLLREGRLIAASLGSVRHWWDESAVFTIVCEDEETPYEVKFRLNGEEVEISEDLAYTLTPNKAGEYTFNQKNG